MYSGNSHLRMVSQNVREKTMEAYTRNRPAAIPHHTNRVSKTRPQSIEPRPMKRNWPSDISVTRRKVSRHSAGATNGRMPSITSINANAASNVLTTARARLRNLAAYFCDLLFLKYLKNSEFGSSTSTSLLLLKLWR